MWPSRKQWKSWSLPSKLTLIGAFVGVLSFVITMLTSFVPPIVEIVKHSNTEKDAPPYSGSSDATQLSSQKTPIDQSLLQIADVYLEDKDTLDIKLKNAGSDSAFITGAFVQVSEDPDVIRSCAIDVGSIEYEVLTT